MQTPTPRRLALLPLEPRTGDRPVIRRYTLARVIDASIAGRPAPAQAPATDVRSP